MLGAAGFDWTTKSSSCSSSDASFIGSIAISGAPILLLGDPPSSSVACKEILVELSLFLSTGVLVLPNDLNISDCSRVSLDGLATDLLLVFEVLSCILVGSGPESSAEATCLRDEGPGAAGLGNNLVPGFDSVLGTLCAGSSGGFVMVLRYYLVLVME